MMNAAAAAPEVKGPAARTTGMTVKGAGREFNAEYICNVSYSGPGRVKALFGIADGMGARASAASELAVNVLKESMRLILESDSVNGNNLLPGCLEEMHARLLAESGGEEKKASAASIVCGYIEGETAHLAAAGGGAAYVVSEGKATRLTAKQDLGALEDVEENEKPEGLIPLGWPGDGFNPVYISRRVQVGDCLVLVSDGLDAKLREKSAADILAVSRTIDEAASSVLAEAGAGKSAEDDMGVVIVRIESLEAKSPAPDIRVKYPVSTYTKKYLAVIFMLCALGAVFYLGARPPAAANRSAAPEAMPVSQDGGGGGERISIPGLRRGEAGVSISVAPIGARVFVNGVQQIYEPGKIFGVPANGDVELRVEADGFDPHMEVLNPKPGERIELTVTLLPSSPDNGSLLILCRPACDALYLDDRRLEGFPKEEILLRQIPPGRHHVKASRGRESEGRALNIASGITQSIIFRFEGERIIDTRAETAAKAEPVKLPPRAVPETPPPPSPLVVSTSPSSETGYPAAVVVEGAGTEPSATKLNRAYFNVTSNVRNCTLMIFKNGKLALTGFCDTRHDIEPGEYVFQVSRPGWKTERKTVTLEGEFKLIEIELERE
jgi:serine/threonine protein phosphatase PrpC